MMQHCSKCRAPGHNSRTCGRGRKSKNATTAERRAQRIAACLCILCGAPRSAQNRRYCETHRELWIENHRRWTREVAA